MPDRALVAEPCGSPYISEPLGATSAVSIIAIMSDDRTATTVHRAGPEDADLVAQLLHDFNTEFDTATPGTSVLTPRLRSLLAAPATIAYLAGDPAAGVALVTLRS